MIDTSIQRTLTAFGTAERSFRELMSGLQMESWKPAPRSGQPGLERLSVHQANQPEEKHMTDNQTLVRNAYKLAEVKDIPGWVSAFTEDGTFTDMSTGVTYRGDALGDLIDIYGTAFSDMHRELYRFYSSDNIVVVQLALQGTQDGPLVLPTGTIPPTGRGMDAPCCDVWELVDGKIKRFDCYPSGSVVLTQLGVIGNLNAVFKH